MRPAVEGCGSGMAGHRHRRRVIVEATVRRAASIQVFVSSVGLASKKTPLKYLLIMRLALARADLTISRM